MYSPVIKLAFTLDKNKITLAISDGSPIRPNGCLLPISSIPSSTLSKDKETASFNSGVSIEPGQTATYNFPVKIKGRRKVQYHIMDIHWNTTDLNL